MYVVLAWFSDHLLSEDDRRARSARFESAVSDLVPETFLRHESGGADWGVTVLHRSAQGAYRWPMIASDDSVTAVSLGLPVGIDEPGGPVALARRLLAGGDTHRDVVPPFGLIALDRDVRFAIQQDWIGMCRLFTATAGGITALCSRPSELAAFLHGSVAPDLDGWASYATTGHFGGDMSPISGVRLMQPGERLTGQRRSGGGWDLTTELRYAVDDVVTAGFARQGRPVDESLDLAAAAITTTASSIGELYPGEITLGLSGGKDSRVIASSVIAAGQQPRFVTNVDTAAEGETAQELMRILRDKRGLRPNHQLTTVAAPDDVLTAGLHERVVRLQRLYDFQYPSSYTVRRPARMQFWDHAAPPSFSGVGGELATGYWYPNVDGVVPEEHAITRLMSSGPKNVAAPEVTAAEYARISGLAIRGRDLGLSGLQLIDYIYLIERVRRWYSSAYVIGLVTPFLSPGFVAASFALTGEQKRAWLLHTGLIARLVPEWSDTPFVSVSTGKSLATRVWDGDGVQAIATMLDTAHGPIAQLFRRDKVEKVLRSAVHQGRADQVTLQQFACLAVASETLEPGTVRPVTSETLTRIMTPPRPPVKRAPERWPRLRWLKRTRAGKALRKLVR